MDYVAQENYVLELVPYPSRTPVTIRELLSENWDSWDSDEDTDRQL
jgi:hypothetical protein